MPELKCLIGQLKWMICCWPNCKNQQEISNRFDFLHSAREKTRQNFHSAVAMCCTCSFCSGQWYGRSMTVRVARLFLLSPVCPGLVPVAWAIQLRHHISHHRGTFECVDCRHPRESMGWRNTLEHHLLRFCLCFVRFVYTVRIWVITCYNHEWQWVWCWMADRCMQLSKLFGARHSNATRKCHQLSFSRVLPLAMTGLQAILFNFLQALRATQVVTSESESAGSHRLSATCDSSLGWGACEICSNEVDSWF